MCGGNEIGCRSPFDRADVSPSRAAASSLSPAPESSSGITSPWQSPGVTTVVHGSMVLASLSGGFFCQRGVERGAHPVYRVWCPSMDVRTVRRRSRRLDLDPTSGPSRRRRTTRGDRTSPAELSSPSACGMCSSIYPRSERAHFLLVAREREHDLSRPGLATLRQQACGQLDTASPPSCR